MSDTIRSRDTSGFTPEQQIKVWSDTLTDLCGRFDIDTLEASSFEGRISYTTVSKLTLCQIEASQHRLAHNASSSQPGSHPFIKMLFQTYGVSHFEQSGRRIDLMPGDCLAYDVSWPHTIVSPGLTRHEVVIVPKRLLHERGFRPAKMSARKLSACTGIGRIAHSIVHAAFDESAMLSPNDSIGVAESLIDLLLLLLREDETMSDRVGPEAMYVRAQFFIREHLRDPDLTIDQISAALGCTKRYLHMLFSNKGITIRDYIRHARLQNSRQELETRAGKSVTDVAMSWGFSSLPQFSRVFRQHFGIVPSAIHRTQIDLAANKPPRTTRY
jgi:AraC family transcriptional regulator, positive regulator of tynA and feaB